MLEFLQPAVHVTHRPEFTALPGPLRQRDPQPDQSGVECRQQTPVELGADPFHDLPVVGEHSRNRRHLDRGKGAREPGRRQGMAIPMVIELCHLLVHPAHSDRADHAYRSHEGITSSATTPKRCLIVAWAFPVAPAASSAPIIRPA